MGLMFFGKTRFKKLAKMLEDLRLKKAALSLFFILGFGTATAQNHDHDLSTFSADSVLQVGAIDAQQAAKIRNTCYSRHWWTYETREHFCVRTA